jgi:hypothetical protein
LLNVIEAIRKSNTPIGKYMQKTTGGSKGGLR